MNVLLRLADFFSPLTHYIAYILAYFFETLFFLLFVTVSLVLIIYVFRKYMARLQVRRGPNRVGKFGLFQLIADMMKLVQKESILPKKRDDLPYKVAPVVVMLGLFLGFALIPYGSFFYIGSLTITHSSVSLILLIAVIAIMPIGEILAGISSHHKLDLLRALRAVE